MIKGCLASFTSVLCVGLILLGTIGQHTILAATNDDPFAAVADSGSEPEAKAPVACAPGSKTCKIVAKVQGTKAR